MDQLIDLIQNTRGTVVSDLKEADAFAWALVDKKDKELTQIGFKHPPLPDNGVRVKITYTGVCQSDIHIIRRKYGDAMPMVLPSVCGHEICGRVIKTGKDVTEFKDGDLVGIGPIRECCKVCRYCQSGQENLCEAPMFKFTAGSYFGGFATEIQLPESFVIKLPEGINEKLCPSLFCAGGTIFNPIRRFAKEGSKVAIIGIGGLGHLGIMFANKLGSKVYAVSTSDSKRAMALELGAHEFVNSKDEEQMKKFQNEAIDLIINTTTVPDLGPYMRGLKKGTGVMVVPSAPTSGVFTLNAAEVILNQWTISGSAAFSKSDAKEMLDLVLKHNIYPRCEFFSWDNFNEAVKKCEENTVEFRSVVDVTSFKP